MPTKNKLTKKLPKPRVGCVRFNESIGSMHLTCMSSVVAHESDVVHYAAVIPCRTAKEAREIVRLASAGLLAGGKK